MKISIELWDSYSDKVSCVCCYFPGFDLYAVA